MNIFDLIAILIFIAFVVVCTLRGFLKTVSRIGAFFAAMILSGIFGELIGGRLLDSEILSAVITLLLFIVLSIVLKKVFSKLAELITKVLHTGVLDKILGALFGILAGGMFVTLLTAVVYIVIVAVDFLGIGNGIIEAAADSHIFTFFIG